MKKKKKGFTLTELIAVIVILAMLALIGVPAYNSIRTKTLQTQYENTVALIETEAAKYASTSGTNLTNVQELIDAGVIETDDGEYLYDPRDNSVMNCYLIEITNENGIYKSKLIDVQECDLAKAKLEYSQINILVKGLKSNEMYTSNAWINEDVIFSIDSSNMPTGEVIKSYRWISGTGQNSTEATMTTNVNLVLNTTVNVEVTTESNHKYFASTAIKIDKESPIIKSVELSSGNDWLTGRDVTISATDQNGSGISGYYLDTVPCDASSTFKEVKAIKEMLKVESIKIYNDTNYYICVKDVVGNIKSYDKNPVVLSVKDTNAPTKPTIVNHSNEEWTKQGFALTLSSSDSESGIGYYQYTFNASATETGSDDTKNWVTYENSDKTEFTTPNFSKERNQYVYVRACDKSGNCSDKNQTMIKIDKTVPATPTIVNHSNEEWTNQNFTLTLSSSDSGSGIGYYQYSYNASATETGEDSATDWVSYSDSAKEEFTTTEFSKERNQSVYVRVCDKVGNCSEKNSTMIKIDKTAPTVPITMEFVYGDWSRYTQGDWAYRTVYAGTSSDSPGPSGSTDAMSGVAYYQISKDNSTWQTYSYVYTNEMYRFATEGTHIRYFRAVDNAGNASSSISRSAKIDLCQSTTASYGSYGTCSASCGDGTKSRTVTYKGISGKTCSTETESTSCNLGACTPKVSISGNIGGWICGHKCGETSCVVQRSQYNGTCIKDVNGTYGNVMGKVTYTANSNTVTFTYTIVQGSETWIGTGHYVIFRIKNSSGTVLYSKYIKESDSSWNAGTTHTGTITYTFKDKETYYIYLDGDTVRPNFDLTFGTITVS